MSNITIGVIWSSVLAAASAFVLLCTAFEKIVKARKAAKAPNIRQEERISALEIWKEKVEKRLSNDDNRLRDIEKGDRATQRALLALLDHGIDGNNIKQMQDAKEELQNHLINR
ncbi:MAG: hypothetical protein IKL24_02280 [Clostridia bacterium]|nr:hypothetical protein [Clostridia bacterium]